jgi:hypothetical protein
MERQVDADLPFLLSAKTHCQKPEEPASSIVVRATVPWAGEVLKK